MALESFDLLHIATGVNPIKTADRADLKNAPHAWAAAWGLHKTDVMSYWVRTSPGSRPPAWWAHDCHDRPAENESELDFLERIGAIGDDEQEAIRAKARELIRYNRGRKPDDPKSMFIPDKNGHIAYSIEYELLADDELPDVF